MIKYLLALSSSISFLMWQNNDELKTPITKEDILKKCDSLRIAGRLDTMVLPVVFFKNPLKRIDSVGCFIVFQDTVWKNGRIQAVGKSIIDPNMDFYKARIGEWTSYYSNGLMESNGHYALAAFTVCRRQQKEIVGYGYKTGVWKYWYSNGVLMAEGLYNPEKSPYPSKCGVDTVIDSRPTLDWIVNDTSGNLVPVDDRAWRLSWLDPIR